jgi:adenylate cyclase
MNFKNIKSPVEYQAIIALSDITYFTKASQSRSNRETFDLLSKFYELTGDIIEKFGGKVIKFMGDSALIIFEIDHAKESIKALRSLVEKSSELLSHFNPECRLNIKVHVGTVVVGLLGVSNEKRLDIIGNSINELFRLQSGGFVISEKVQELLNS